MEDYLACANAVARGDLHRFLAGGGGGSTVRRLPPSGGGGNGSDGPAGGGDRIFLAARAFSAGGVVVGAALNASPRLFGAVALTNPFLDVAGTMADVDLHLTEHEWDEFGNPVDDEQAGRSIAEYCPFTNLQSGGSGSSNSSTPPVFLIGTLDDERVPFWNTVCYGMKMRDKRRTMERCDEDNREHFDVFIHVEEEGGHHLNNSERRLSVAELETRFLLGQYGRWKKKKNAVRV